ncbi:MAG: TolC family protein [Desulfocapsa sp.]|nr:TolC family protein [Desulfocapsa sp.]
MLSGKNKIRWFLGVLLLISGVTPVTAAFSSTNEADTLSGYLEQALTGNDALRKARAEFRISTEKTRQAGVLPDPKLVVQYYLQPVETRTGPQNAAIGISQSLPWFSKLALLREMSNHEVAIAGAGLAGVELAVARQVKEAYIEYGFLGLSQQTVADNIELLRYLEGVARSRYAAGKAPYFDVLKIQIELAKTEEKALALADQAYPLRVHINNLLGTEAERVRIIPHSLPLVVLEKSEDTIHSLSLLNAPLLQTGQQLIARARTGKELAEKDFFPDFNFSLNTILTGSAEYGDPPDSGRNPIIAGLNVNLPIFRDRRHAKVAEQEAGIMSAQSFQQEQMRLLETQIEQDLYAYREAQRKLMLYRDELLPKVKQQLEVAVNGFQSGENSILELIDAEKGLLIFGLAEKRALADRALAVARLEARAGVVLANWEQ